MSVKPIINILSSNQNTKTIIQPKKINYTKITGYGAVGTMGFSILAANSKKEGVVTLPSGLQYEVLVEGNGKQPTAADRVQCHYEGTLIDGTLFDSSVKRGEPAVFGVTQVIPGWVEALQLMKEGAKWRLYIPYQMAYGEHGAGEMIPPYSALIFEVELIKVL